MKNRNKNLWLGILAITLVLGMTITACDTGGGGSNNGGGKTDYTANNVGELLTWLTAQPANAASTPYKVKLSTNDLTDFGTLSLGLDAAGRYVYLELTSPLTTIPFNAFFSDALRKGCVTLVGITIPNSVTSIGYMAFVDCTSLTSVTFQGTITEDNFNYAFEGDLRDKYLAGGIGTYTRNGNGSDGSPYVWTKQSNNGGGGGGGDVSLGNTLTITDAQVYFNSTEKFTGTVTNLSYIRRWTDNGFVGKSLNEFIDGNPTVTLTEGKLNVKLGKPKASALYNMWYDSGMTISPTNAKIFTISEISNSSDLDNGTFVTQIVGDYIGGVEYWYSDKNVNVSGTHTEENGQSITYAMNLKAGWNSVLQIYGTESNGYRMSFKTGELPANTKWVVNVDN